MASTARPKPASGDSEVAVLDALVSIMELLDDAARHRALVWAWGRYVDDRGPWTVDGGPSTPEEEP